LYRYRRIASLFGNLFDRIIAVIVEAGADGEP
jgi:hypothetical protein